MSDSRWKAFTVSRFSTSVHLIFPIFFTSYGCTLLIGISKFIQKLTAKWPVFPKNLLRWPSLQNDEFMLSLVHISHNYTIIGEKWDERLWNILLTEQTQGVTGKDISSWTREIKESEYIYFTMIVLSRVFCTDFTWRHFLRKTIKNFPRILYTTVFTRSMDSIFIRWWDSYGSN